MEDGDRGKWLLRGDDVKSDDGVLSGIVRDWRWVIHPDGWCACSRIEHGPPERFSAVNEWGNLRTRNEAAALVAKLVNPPEPHPLLLAADTMRTPNSDGWLGFWGHVNGRVMWLTREDACKWSGTLAGCGTAQTTAAGCLDALLAANGMPKWAGGTGRGMLKDGVWVVRPPVVEPEEKQAEPIAKEPVKLEPGAWRKGFDAAIKRASVELRWDDCQGRAWAMTLAEIRGRLCRDLVAARDKLEADGRVLRRMVLSLTAQFDAMKDRAELAEWKLGEALDDMNYLEAKHEREMAEVGAGFEGLQKRLDAALAAAGARMGELEVAREQIGSLERRIAGITADRNHWRRMACAVGGSPNG